MLLHSLTPLPPNSPLHLLTGGAVQSSHANILGGGWAVDASNLKNINYICMWFEGNRGSVGDAVQE